jgi:prevent-host-death family protein
VTIAGRPEEGCRRARLADHRSAIATTCYSRGMAEPDRVIPQRELRNDVAEVLREVAGGRRVRITVRGRPVADLVPVSEPKRFVARSEFQSILTEDPLDPGFVRDVQAALGSTIDEL